MLVIHILGKLIFIRRLNYEYIVSVLLVNKIIRTLNILYKTYISTKNVNDVVPSNVRTIESVVFSHHHHHQCAA